MTAIISYFFGPTLVDFYHYTSEAAADLIIQSGVIKESPDGGPDAMLGTGKITAVPEFQAFSFLIYSNTL